MSAAQPPAPQVNACPHCHRALDMVERLVVALEGDLIACADCASQLGAVGRTLTLAEWEAHDATRAALAAYGIGAHTLAKAPFAPALRPRAHVWLVSTAARTLILTRQDNAPNEAAVRFEAALREHLAAARLPVAPFLLAADGAPFWSDATAARWTLHEAPRGAPFASDVALWNLAGNIGGVLAQLHAAARPLAMQSPPPTAWRCWTLETLRARLSTWPSLPELTHELRDRAVERLVTSKTFEALETLPQAITHGNFGRAAVFRDAFGPTGVSGFEHAHRDAAICDFAFGLVNQFRPIVRAAVKAYERERPLDEAERHALPEVLLLGRLIRVDRQLTIWHDPVMANQHAKAIAHLLDHAEGLRNLG